MIGVTADIAIAEQEIRFDFVRASGPGGQNVNKVSSAVQLRFDVGRTTALPGAVKKRLREIAGRKLTTDGILVIQASRFKSQALNRQDAVQRLVDLIRQADVAQFFEREQPEYVILAAARVGGIWANDTFPAEFIYQNLMIQTNIIHAAYLSGVKKLLFLGSSCIYPKYAPQPINIIQNMPEIVPPSKSKVPTPSNPVPANMIKKVANKPLRLFFIRLSRANTKRTPRATGTSVLVNKAVSLA